MKEIVQKLPCGVEVIVTDFNSSILIAYLRDPESAVGMRRSFKLNEDGSVVTLYVDRESLPGIRRLIDKLDPPKSKWYKFWEG